ncbi:hypothetical protein [Nocardioides zeicaulis]|uniref:Uncharacterized protein n=1 Tax=Nocardioides zeicaulis TaxID=1776857 RepID=A0ABV6E442_9ACTN
MGRSARRVVRAGVVLASLACLLIALLLLEATGGHDGWLCEWGIDSDGAGTTISGCG